MFRCLMVSAETIIFFIPFFLTPFLVSITGGVEYFLRCLEQKIKNNLCQKQSLRVFCQ